MGQRKHPGFSNCFLEFLKRMSFSKTVEWAIVLWMYLWIVGFVIAIAIATVRGYVEVFREARSFERSLWKG